MTNDISIATKKTLKQRILKYSIFGGIGLGVYLMVLGGGTLIDKSQYKGRVKKVHSALENRDYALAKVLLEEYSKRKKLDSIDTAQLKLRTQREEGHTRFSEFIKRYDTENASKTLTELKQSGIYTPGWIEVLEKELEGIKPENLAEKIRRESEGLKDRIRTASKQEVIKLCRDYLSLYSKEKDSSEVVEKLLLTEFKDLMSMFQNIRDIDDVLDLTQKLNMDVIKYGSTKNNLAKIVLEEDMLQKADSYIKQKEKDSTESNPQDIIIGAKVRFVESRMSSWSEEYNTERAYNIPLGSVGTIINEHTGYTNRYNRGAWVVEFDKNKKYNWNREWDLYPYWKEKGHQGIAIFYKQEIEVIKPANPVQIREFKVEFEKLKENYNKFLKTK